jgi:cysteine desulfurase
MQAPDDPIYLDYNATTPILPEVVDAMLPYLREHFGNPSSGHVYGRRARQAVDRAREQVGALLGSEPDEIFFTSGGTEANNLAIRGVAATRTDRKAIVTSTVEHPATANLCNWLDRNGWTVSRMNVDADGCVRLDHVRDSVTQKTALVTVMHSNNETGVLQPIARIAQIARSVGALIHTDAAQSVGKVGIKVRELDVDLLSVAGHKLYAPKGVGALFVRRGVHLTPMMLGASHEHGMRPGTENVASIVALGTACEVAQRDLDTVAARVRELREQLWDRLRRQVPNIQLNGHATLRLPNTLNVRFPGVSGAALLAAAPEVAASTGSACHDGHETASSVLLAMGVPPAEALGSVRLTLGRSTTVQDIERASEALLRAWRQLVSASNLESMKRAN